MTRPADFKPGARVRWAGDEFIIWSVSAKPGRRWITRDGKPPIEARVSNLELIDAPLAAAAKPSRPKPALVAANPHPLTDRDRRAITAAIMCDAADHDGVVNPNRVRARLSNEHGLTVAPRLLSGTYSALAARGVLRSLGYVGVNDDVRSGNAGKPQRQWQWVGPLPAAQEAIA